MPIRIKSIITGICLILLTGRFIQLIVENQAVLIQTVDVAALQEKYDYSPYQPQNEYRGIIEDDELYTLAGYRYLTGSSPDSINHETQPLQKYLYGLSVIIFGNAAIIQVCLAFGVLIATFLLSKNVLPLPLAAIPPLLVSFDGLYAAQFATSYLDMGLTFFFLLGLLVVIKYPHAFKLQGLMVGCIALAKSFTHGIMFMAFTIIHSLINKTFKWQTTLIVTISSLAIYLISYGNYWLDHSLTDFFTLHLSILKLYAGYVPEYPKGEIVRIIIAGQWQTWFGDFGYRPVSEWWWLWPAGLISQFILTWQTFRRNLKPATKWLLIWSWIYFISLIPRLVFPRYLLPLIPLWAIYIVQITTAMSTRRLLR
jgi:hypothetical protein